MALTGQPATTVLFADPDPAMVRVFAAGLTRAGFAVVTPEPHEPVPIAIERTRPSIVVVPVEGSDGVRQLVSLAGESPTPVVAVTAGADPSWVEALELGADDAMARPFTPRELAARVRAVLRRASAPALGTWLVVGDLAVDIDRREARVGDAILQLTAREFDLLAFFAASPGQVFSRAQLLQHVWRVEPGWLGPATVTEHVRRLRRALESSTVRIETVWSVGYRLVGP